MSINQRFVNHVAKPELVKDCGVGYMDGQKVIMLYLHRRPNDGELPRTFEGLRVVVLMVEIAT